MWGVWVVGSEFRFSRRSLIAALALLGPELAGCSSSTLSDSWSFASLLSGSTVAGNANASAPGLSLPANFECPSVQVRNGAATLAANANPTEPTAMNLKYQVTINTTARECRMGPGNTVSLKIGMQGRVILGPEGGNTTSIDVPLRFAVVEETIDSKVIATKLDRFPVAIPPNDGNVLFSHVSEGLDFPMPKGGYADNYIIYIGFDPAGLEPERKKPAPRPKRPAKPNRPTG